MAEIKLNSAVWLGSQVGRVLKTLTFTSESATTVSENGRSIIKAGTLVNDNVLGYGLVLNDVDVTDGPRVGSLMIRGEFINSGLPVSLSTAQRSTLAAQGLRDVEQSVLQLYVQPVNGSEVLFGKAVSELQENISLGASQVLGTLKYVEGYTQFSSNVEEQSGHYIALKATAIEGSTIKAQVINGTHGEVTLDSDGMIVVRIANNTQSIRFTAINGDDSEIVEYSFANTVLEPKTYSITTSITNGSYSGDDSIRQNSTASVTITAGEGYDLPVSVTVTNALYTYDDVSGVINLRSPSGNVTISAECPTAINLQVRPAADYDGVIYAKVASDLQENVAIDENNVISGTLKYLTGYTAFSGSDQNGNFLALKATALAGCSISGQVEFGPSGQVAYGIDNEIVFRIESISERIIITATIDGRSQSIILTLDNLRLEHAPVSQLTPYAVNDVIGGLEFNTSLSISGVCSIIDQISGATSGEGKTLVHFQNNGGELIAINQDGLYAVQYFDSNGFSAIIFASQAVPESGIETAGWQPSLSNGVLQLPSADIVSSIDTVSENVWNGVLTGGIAGTIVSLTPFQVGDVIIPDANDKYEFSVDTSKTSEITDMLSSLTYSDMGGMDVAILLEASGSFPVLMAYRINDGGTYKYALMYSGGQDPIIFATDSIIIPDMATVNAGWNSNIGADGIYYAEAPSQGMQLTIASITSGELWNGTIIGKVEVEPSPKFTPFQLGETVTFGDKFLFDTTMSDADVISFAEKLDYTINNGVYYLTSAFYGTSPVFTFVKNNDDYSLVIGDQNKTTVWSSVADAQQGIIQGWQNLESDGSFLVKHSLYNADSFSLGSMDATQGWNGYIIGFGKANRLTVIENNDTAQTFEFNTSLDITTVKSIVSEWTGWQQSTGYEFTEFMDNTGTNAQPFNVIRASGQNGYIYAIFLAGTYTCIWTSEAFTFGQIVASVDGWQYSNLNDGKYTLNSPVTFGTFNGTNYNWNGFIIGKSTQPSGGLTPFDANDEFTQIQFSDDTTTVGSAVSGIASQSGDVPVMTITLSAMGGSEVSILNVYYSGQDIHMGVIDIPLFENDHYETTADFTSLNNLFTWDYSTLTLTINSGTATFVSGDSGFNGVVYGKVLQ